MTNTKIALLTVVMVAFTAALILAFTVFGTGETAVYGDEYVTKYFQRDEVMKVHIEIGEADWEYMMENPTEEEFRTAKVIVNGDVYSSVAIRTKGNSSLSSVARSDSNRYSFKLNFDEVVQNQTMAGLTQLNLNNCFSDPSYMREYLSYQIFEEMGVATPAFSYAAVYVNGEYFGLYLAVESILEPYLERNFGDITGDLYKSVGNTLKYNGSDPSDYTGLEVKSTLKNADWSQLIKMLDTLNNGGDIEKHLDVDEVLRYLAVSTALVNFDSYQGNFGHNYYLYEQNGVFKILPWDLNMAFGGFSFEGDATSVYIDEPTQGAVAERPLIAKLLADEEYLKTYHGYLEQIATAYLSGDYLKNETTRLHALIAEYVKTDPTAFYTYEQFEKSISGTICGGAMGDENQDEGQADQQEADNASGRQGFHMGGARGFGNNVPGILELAAAMSESIQRQLSGELPSTNNGNGMGGGMGAKGAPNAEGAPPAAQQPPDGDAQAAEGGARSPGGMNLPEGLDREALDKLRQEIKQAGELTDEIRAEAEELGIPDHMIEMLAGGRGGMMPGAPHGEGTPHAEGTQTDRPTSATALAPLLASGAVIIAGIIAVLLFRRRKYVTR